MEQKILIIDGVTKTGFLLPFKSQISHLSCTSFTHKTLSNRVALLQHEVTLNQAMVFTLQRYPRNIALIHSTVQKNRLLLSDLISFNCQTLTLLFGIIQEGL